MAGRRTAAVQVAPAPTKQHSSMCILDMLRILRWQLQGLVGVQVCQEQKASTAITGQEIAETNMRVEVYQSLKKNLVPIVPGGQRKAEKTTVKDVDISRHESEERECTNVKHLSPKVIVDV